MKANHPVAFLAGCMSLAIANTDRLAALRQDAARAGIALLPPDINRSGADFTIERAPDGNLAIRYALAAVKRVGKAAMDAVAAARGDRPFASLADFAERVDARQLNKMQLEGLARAGAFDTLEPARARAFAAAEMILRRAQSAAEARGSGQDALFGASGPAERLPIPDAPEWPEMERLAAEAEAIGFHMTAHPLDAYGASMRRLGVVSAASLDARAGQRVRVAGLVVAVKERTTRTGTRMAWVRLSDTTGSFEATLFSEILSRCRDMIAIGTPLLVTADLKSEGDALRITASDVVRLDDAAAQAGSGLRIWLDRTEAVPHIRTLLGREGKGRGRVTLIPRLGPREEVEVTLPGGWQISSKLAQAMKTLPGVERVEEA